MPEITISINDETKSILQKKANKNLCTLREQIEDIVRKSAVGYKTKKNCSKFKVDDKLVEIFSREIRGKKK
ncbi:MAG: hypothetical protein V1824_02720 [archaeon]